MPETKQVSITYGEGDPKKGSVRMKAISGSIPKATDLPDVYVPRTILNALNVKDDESVTVTFTKAAK